MKLPAYARPLLARRCAGNHPFEVYLLYGPDWDVRDMPRPMPFLAIAPRDFKPYVFDLRCVVGIDVYLETRAPGWLALAGELARHARTVFWRSDEVLYHGETEPRANWGVLDTLALECRLTFGTWPEWWTFARARRAA